MSMKQHITSQLLLPHQPQIGVSVGENDSQVTLTLVRVNGQMGKAESIDTLQVRLHPIELRHFMDMLSFASDIVNRNRDSGCEG